MVERDSEGIATRIDQRELASCRERIALDHVPGLGPVWMPPHTIQWETDPDPDELMLGQLVPVEVPGFLEHDAGIAETGPVDVIVVEKGELPFMPRPEIGRPEIERA
jgi:hypothetical protein